MLNNVYRFWMLFALSVLLFAVSVVLQYKVASAGYLVAAIMLLEAHFARKDVRYNNPLRTYYKKRGKLEKFRNICIISFIVFFSLGSLGIILRLLNVWS